MKPALLLQIHLHDNQFFRLLKQLKKWEKLGGDGYRRMINLCAAGRAGTPDEVATVAALLIGQDGGFITGSDFLMDGGVTAAYWYGELTPNQNNK